MISIRDEKVVMKVNGLQCAFHMPTALVPKFHKKDENRLWTPDDGIESRGNEIVQNLPPAAPRYVFPVDEYPSCPANWMHGSPKASSYWLPVRTGCGMWLDFNYNYENSHHVAVVVSIQGVNPITGQQTKQLRLEQYHETCPVHNAPFGQNRYCEQCGYQWDAQNYIGTNATPHGMFWIDGFRGGDGFVRQYVFTEETCKGVAAGIIGEERVFAIGIAFYLSREPKPVKPIPPELAEDANYSGGVNYCGSGIKLTKGAVAKHDIATFKRVSLKSSYGNMTVMNDQNLPSDIELSKGSIPSEIKCTMPIEACKLDVMSQNPQLLGVATDTGLGAACASDMDYEYSTALGFAPNDSVSPSEVGHDLKSLTPEEAEIEIKKLEITAGARIKQRIFQDPEQPNFWQDEPAGFIYINYCSIADAERIMKGGHNKRSGSFLSTIGF